MAQENESYWKMLREAAVFATRKKVFTFSLVMSGIVLLTMLLFYYHLFTVGESGTTTILSLGMSLVSLVVGAVSLVGLVISTTKKRPDPFHELEENKYRVIDVFVVALIMSIIVAVSGMVGLGLDMLVGTGSLFYFLLVMISTILLLFSYYELLLGKKGILESISGSVRLVTENPGKVVAGWLVLTIVVAILVVVYALPALVLFGMASLKGIMGNPQMLAAIESGNSTLVENMTLRDFVDVSVFTENIVLTIVALLVFWVGSAFTQGLNVGFMARLYKLVSTQPKKARAKKTKKK